MFELPVSDPCPLCEYLAGRPFYPPNGGDPMYWTVVDENDETVAFVNFQRPIGFPEQGPPAPCWVVIIPRRHAPTLLDLSATEAMAMMAHAHRIAKAVMTSFEPDGLRLLQNNGIAGDQTVAHVHLHVIPCQQGGASGLEALRERGSRVPAAERQQIAERIRAYLTV